MTRPPKKSGELQHSVTQRDIAERCGLHQTAVSLALRGDTRRVNPDTIARVQAVAAELGYNPDNNHAARRMVMRRHGVTVLNQLVALILPPDFYKGPYSLEPFLGIMGTLAEAGYDAVTTNLGMLDSRDITHSRSLARGDIDGLLAFWGPDMGRRVLGHLRRLPSFDRRPVVSVLRRVPDSSAVVADEAGGSYQAARHLLRQGHRHVLICLALYGEEIAAERVTGIRRAMVECGLDPADSLHVLTLGYGWISPVAITSELPPLTEEHPDGTSTPWSLPEYLRTHPAITAMLAWNDPSAIHAWRLLELAGRRVPQDLSIIGFDDTYPWLDAHGRNLLTSVRLPLRQVGEEAARLVLRQIADGTANDTLLALPTTLIERGSTAPAGR